ncbi:hypothetical protein N431DRAFT_503052 [Stipitochalara longipes BDJ]|nr:hypothetical protein N431DRAFT_503052 [Stipitochalara longipes BDJ]
MVSFTTLISAISMALLSTTVSAAPAITEERQSPPPTSSVLDFTLYKTTQPGDESKCWTSVGTYHVAPTDLLPFDGVTTNTVCNKADFYVVHIDATYQGYNCYVAVFDDNNCLDNIGWVTESAQQCTNFYSSYGLVTFNSWKVVCSN